MRISGKAHAFALAASIGAMTLGSSAVHGAVERVDELVQNALQLDQDVEQGGALYRRHCASCHGPKAHGNAARRIPALAGQRQAYLIKQLADFTELERDSPNMHGVVSQADLSEPQVWANIAAFVNGLPVARSQQRGAGKRLELGEAIFREQCASCHEEDARGDDDGFVPSLRNQHYSYLLKEMRSMASWHRHNVDPDLVRFLDSLQDDEMIGLADYLSRQRGPTRDRLKMRSDGNVGD